MSEQMEWEGILCTPSSSQQQLPAEGHSLLRAGSSGQASCILDGFLNAPLADKRGVRLLSHLLPF